jgi:biotin carboxylase
MSAKDTLLLLGASSDQLFVIRTAKSMGLRVLTVDMNPKSPGFDISDDYAVISTRDIPSLKAFIDEYLRKGNKIVGVTVMGSDIPQVVAALGEYLDTPTISTESARLATEKYEMKCRLKACGIPIPWFSLVNSADSLKEIAKSRGYPLVIKPVDRSGSRGVFRLTEGCELNHLFELSKSVSFSGKVMVEDYIPGLQISTESIMYRGRAHTPGFADRNYEKLELYKPHIIENGGWVPSIVTRAQREAVENLIERAASALGIHNGVVKGDVVLTDRGPMIIELAARLSGGDFSESLIPLGCGVNIVEAAINLAIGKEIDLDKLKPRWNKCVINRYFFPAPGRLVSIDGYKYVRNKPWVKKLEFFYKPGDIVESIKSHADRFGVFIVIGDTREEAVARSEWVYKNINILTEPI